MIAQGYSTLLRETPWVKATGRRLRGPAGLHNDELGQHLATVRAQVAADGADAQALPAVLDHLRHVQWHYTIEDADLPSALAWASQSQALLMAGGAVLDPDGQVLIGAGAGPGAVPVHPEAAARADRVRRDLLARGVAVPAGAIPVRSTEEISVRRPDQIAKRAVALVVSADFALSVLDGEPLDAGSMEKIYPRSLAERTASEQALFAERDPVLAAQLKWGYEAAAQLLAMCGRVEAGFPREFADQGQVWNASVGVEEAELLRSLTPIPAAKICAAWETARALHHTVTLARAKGVRPPAELDHEIVRQRYRAMEWLAGDTEWDAVDVTVPCWAPSA